MADFVRTAGSDRIRSELERAIHGRGAFRMFKDALHRHKIENDWYSFRDQAMKQIAIAFCNENDLACKGSPRRKRGNTV